MEWINGYSSCFVLCCIPAFNQIIALFPVSTCKPSAVTNKHTHFIARNVFFYYHSVKHITNSFILSPHVSVPTQVPYRVPDNRGYARLSHCHFDEQGHKNSVKIYQYSSYWIFIFSYSVPLYGHGGKKVNRDTDCVPFHISTSWNAFFYCLPLWLHSALKHNSLCP